MLDKDIEKILITREEIQNRCSELGKERKSTKIKIHWSLAY